MNDDIDIRKLVKQGYSYDEIIDVMLDEGYDKEDIDEALLNLGYDWQDAVRDAIKDQAIDLDDAHYYADLLDTDTYDVYFMYFYGEESE